MITRLSLSAETAVSNFLLLQLHC